MKPIGLLDEDGQVRSLLPVALFDGEVEDTAEFNIPYDEQTPWMVEFRERNDCVWRTVGGRKVCIKPKGTLQERAARALSTYKASSREVQDLAAQGEAHVSRMLGGEVTKLYSNKDGKLTFHPIDIHPFRVSGRMHAVEVKTFVHNSNDKVTMHPAALFRKLGWSKRNKIDSNHTIVVDYRDRAPDAKSRKFYSGHRIYYRQGFGSFRLGTMTPVRNAEHLKQLIRESGK